MSQPLKYKCNLLVAGAWFSCIESYESVFVRLRDSQFNFDTDEGDRPEGMRYAEPLELTVGMGGFGEEKDESRLVRAAFAPQAISAVCEIPEDVANEIP